MQVAVLGGGSFGTAISNIVAANGYAAALWFRDAERAATAQRERVNRHYFPDYPLHDNLTITCDLKAALSSAEVVVMAIPSASFRAVARSVAPLLAPHSKVISATKGIEAPSFTLMSEVLRQELPGAAVGVLSGPNFADEIVRNLYTASVLASEDEQMLERIPQMFSSSTFRVYTSRDRFGVELAGALKNIYAIVTGMADAFGCGHNTQAMLLTRALAEMSRFAARLGADVMTFLGLAGVGDLFLTCSSDLSRNYRVGHAVGRGLSLDSAVAEVGQVAEGVNTLKIVHAKARELDVYMPLAAGLYGVLFEGRDISQVVGQLMSGQTARDVEFDRTR